MARVKKNNPDEKQNKEKTERQGIIHQWLERIDWSERYRKKTAERYKWRQLSEEYRGYFVGLTDATDIYIPSLNLIFAYVKSEVPSLYLKDPKIKVNPKKTSSVISAKILEKALNAIWRTKRLKRENKKNILDSLIVGHSWFKTGYQGEFASVEDGNGNKFEFVAKDEFFGYRVPYENITFNPDANDPPYDCTWIAQEVWAPLDEVKANKKFKNTENLQAATIPVDDKNRADIHQSDERNRQDPTIQRAKLYEVWDKRTNSVFVISPGCDDYLQEPRPFPYKKMRGFPFSFLRLNDDPVCPYGIPDCYMFEPQVIELMKIRAAAIDHIKRYNRQLLLAKGAMDPDMMEQFKQGITGAVLEVRTNGKPLSDTVMPIPYPPLQTDIYAIEDRIKEDLINVSGQSANDRGAQQKTTTRTVKELMEIQKGGENRRSEKVDTIEDFIEDIASNFVALLQQYADEPFYVAVSGEDPDEIQQMIAQRPSAKKPGAITNKNGFTTTKDDIQGEFDYEIVPGSTKPLDQEQTLDTLQQLYEMAKDRMIPGGPVETFFTTEFADQLDMEGLKIALDAEKQMAQQQMAMKQQQAQQQQQMVVGQNAAELELKAQREATRQQEVQLKGIDMIHNHQMDQIPEEQTIPEELLGTEKVLKSINFKDLPPDGKVQLAREAGLYIATPPPDPKPVAPKAAPKGNNSGQ